MTIQIEYAERGMLGGLMLDASEYPECRRRASPQDFSRQDFADIYSAMGDLNSRGTAPDPATLKTMMNGRANPNLIDELFMDATTAANAVHYADIIHDNGARRRLAELVKNDAPLEDIAAAVNREIIVTEPHTWPEPQPIPSGLLPVEPFDDDMLPNIFRPWVSDIAERMQCPPDYSAVGALVALSSVVGRKLGINPKRFDDWIVFPNLWGMIVGRPGLMKSPALAQVIQPLERLAADARVLHKDQRAEYERTAKFRAMAQKETENRAAKAIKDGNPDGAMQLLADADAEASLDAPPPGLRRYKVTDTTMEALAEILMEPENKWGLLAYRDELHGLLRGMDREGQEGARAFFLQGYDASQSNTTDRIGRGKNLHIEAVTLAMLGGIQPGKLRSYIRAAVTESSADDGLLQRFGMLVWPDASKEWINIDRWPDTEAKTAAFETFARLDALEPATDKDGNQIPHILRFSADAQEVFNSWRAEHEVMLRSESMHPAMESHLAKYRKLVPALALMFALADHQQCEHVGRESLLRALAWKDYLESHAARAYGSGRGLDFQPAEALLMKLRSGKIPDNFTPREVYLKGWAHLSDPEIVCNACDILADLDHLQRTETRPHNGGRPSVSFRINPHTRKS
jgi:putative DNA primase/helicase